MKKTRVAVAMSGGVDSSAAAALLVGQGYDVVGVFFHFWSEPRPAFGGVRQNICCSLESQEDARRVCAKLGIPFYTLNMVAPFKKKIVDDFLRGYQNCRTPNPCVRCNQFIKFDEFWRKAKIWGVDFIATGHYAKIRGEKLDVGGFKKQSLKLLRPRDKEKGQTYFLHRLTQLDFAHTLFPLADYTKSETRKLALKFGLPTAEKVESQEICFIADADIHAFLGRYLKFKPGEIRKLETDKIIGRHNGLVGYTIGQRKGIKLSGGPWYVARLDNAKNALWVTKDESKIYQREFKLKKVNWISGNEPEFPLSAVCRVRYKANDKKAIIYRISKTRYCVVLNEPERAVTPGQYCVFWRGNECLGGGEIE